LAIGDEHNHLALGVRIPQPVERNGDGVANGGAVLDDVGAKLLHHLLQHAVVQGEWGLGVGSAGEDHQTNAVVHSGRDEIGERLLGHADAVAAAAERPEVTRFHRRAEVEGDDDVDALHR